MALSIIMKAVGQTYKINSKHILNPVKKPLYNLQPLTLLMEQLSTASVQPDKVMNEELDKLYRLVEVEVRGHDPAVLKSYSWFATTAASELGIKVGECWAPRKAKHDRLILLKAVHIYKKHRVQYEFRTYFRFMQFLHLTGSTADTFLEYIQRNLPEGVAMKVTKVEVTSLPPQLVRPPSQKSDQPQEQRT